MTGVAGEQGTGLGRGPYAAGRTRRAQIIELAKDHFARSGYSGTSTAVIARSAGITEAGLLHHFRSKRELLLGVLAATEAESGQRAEALLEGVATPAELWATLVRLAEHNAAAPGLVELYVVLSGEATTVDHPAHAWFVERYTRILNVSTATLRRGVETGAIRSDTDCEAVARETVAMQDGLQLQWVLGGCRFDLATAVRHYVDGLARSLEPDRP